MRELARLYGVQGSYRDAAGNPRRSPQDAVVAVLRALGAPIDGPRDAPQAVREVRARLAARLLPPVAVSWDGRGGTVRATVPSGRPGSLRCVVELASGGTRACALSPAEGETGAPGAATATVALPGDLEPGYHRLVASAGGLEATTTLVAAPRRASRAPVRRRGVYLPLYALHSRTSPGGGTLSDLARLGAWLGGAGGSAVAILPILAAFLDEPYEPSPYMPVSRRLWNELVLDLERVPALEASSEARRALDRARPALAELRSAPLVDHRHQAALLRPVIERLAESLGELDPPPLVREYARFRAACAAHGVGWRDWPQEARRGRLREGDVPASEQRYHECAQVLVGQQLAHVTSALRDRDVALLLDLPLGVHPDGFDAWREQERFVSGVSVGAPPDAFFTLGQAWGFAPLHPHASREDGHRYFRSCLEHHMREADSLRLDHVMSLHRLFLVPDGAEAADGVYVRYPAEELYAIVCLESHRHGTPVVGENLGTVPQAVNAAMRRHSLARMRVLQLELGDADPLRPGERGTLATLNTHDMPSFASFWRGAELDDRVALGLLDLEQAEEERAARARMRASVVGALRARGMLCADRDDEPAVLRGLLAHLGSGEAETALVGLEDLWLETAPQNTPGTTSERSNWRRKACLSLEQLEVDDGAAAGLRALVSGAPDGR